MARHFRGLNRRPAEVAQALQADPRLLNGRRRRRCTLHLAHLAAQHVIRGFLVAPEADATHVGALAGVHEELHGDRILFLVQLGNPGHLGEVIALVAQAPGEILLGGSHQLLGEGLPLGHQQETTQVLFRQYQVTRKVHRTHGVLLPLGDVGGDIDCFLVRRHGHLGGIDAELQVTAVQVMGGQGFQVPGKLLPGILVVVGEERKPAGGLEFEQVGEILVAVDLVAHHVDMLDCRSRPLIHVDIDGYPVARLRQYLGLDIGIVTPLLDVLTLEFQLHASQG